MNWLYIHIVLILSLIFTGSTVVVTSSAQIATTSPIGVETATSTETGSAPVIEASTTSQGDVSPTTVTIPVQPIQGSTIQLPPIIIQVTNPMTSNTPPKQVAGDSVAPVLVPTISAVQITNETKDNTIYSPTIDTNEIRFLVTIHDENSIDSNLFKFTPPNFAKQYHQTGIEKSYVIGKDAVFTVHYFIPLDATSTDQISTFSYKDITKTVEVN